MTSCKSMLRVERLEQRDVPDATSVSFYVPDIEVYPTTNTSATGVSKVAIALPTNLATDTLVLVDLVADPVDAPPAPVQGTRPPIDMTQGVVAAENVQPWGPNGPSGTAYTVPIGTNPDGTPINITVWVAYSPLSIQYHYWCHGLTFFGGGPLSQSVWGNDVPAILAQFYTPIRQNQVQAGDILVFTDANGGVKHSCVIVTPVFNDDGTLNLAQTIVDTKNGQNLQQQTTLAALVLVYPNLTMSPYTGK